jgi:hypothetical protein
LAFTFTADAVSREFLVVQWCRGNKHKLVDWSAFGAVGSR